MVVGSVVNTCALALTYLLMDSFWSYTMFYGFLYGVGMCCIFLPAITSIGFYFDRRQLIIFLHTSDETEIYLVVNTLLLYYPCVQQQMFGYEKNSV